jgi:hypothetical protein
MSPKVRKYRLFAKAAHMFGAALVIAALLVNAVPPRVASAHHPELSGSVACQPDGTKLVTWTINNWSGTTLNMTITAINRSIGVAVGTVVSSSVQGSESFPGNTHGVITLTVSGSWPNGATGTTNRNLNLGNNDCPQPPPPDVCPNIEGNQATIPDGMQKDESGNCVPIPPPDVCPNLDGIQESLPEGMILDEDGNCVPPPPPPDVCPNIEGLQIALPQGMVFDESGNCVPPPPPDVCPNLDGTQESLPAGMVFDESGNCVPIPPDYQLNLSHIECVDGQVEVHFVLLNVPDGITPGTLTYTYGAISPGAHTGNVWHYTDHLGDGIYNITSASVVVDGVTVNLHNPGAYAGSYQCSPPPDVCPNIDGLQVALPEGMVFDESGNCVPPPPPDVCPNIEGTQESLPEGMILDESGNCVPPPPPDVCPNLDGTQESLPAGMVFDESGNCVPIPPPPTYVTICYNNQTMTIPLTDLPLYPGATEGECPLPPQPAATILCFSLEFLVFRLTVVNNGPQGEIGYSTDLDATIHSLGVFSNGETGPLELPEGVSVLYLYGKLQTGWDEPVVISLNRSQVAACEEDPISLSSVCTDEDDGTPIAWQVANLNNFSISITWSIDGGPSGGPVGIPANGSYSFSTAYYPGLMNVYVDGVLLASAFAQNCGEPPFAGLSVAAFCTRASPATYGWRVTNPNGYAVDFEYRINASIMAGVFTVGGNSTFDFQTAQSIGSIAMIYYGGDLQDTATGMATCPDGPPPENPPEEPPLIPPTGGDPVLIPVTGLDLSAPGTASLALFNLGLAFFGIGIVLQGLARRRERFE